MGIGGTAGGEADGPEIVGGGWIDKVAPPILSFCCNDDGGGGEDGPGGKKPPPAFSSLTKGFGPAHRTVEDIRDDTRTGKALASRNAETGKDMISRGEHNKAEK